MHLREVKWNAEPTFPHLLQPTLRSVDPGVYVDAGATKHIISNGNLEISTLHNFPSCRGPIKAIYEQNERAGELLPILVAVMVIGNKHQ